MLDDFREWLSDNLRYILLGLAAILVLIIIIFAVKLVTGSGKSEKKESEISTEAQTEQESESEQDVSLTENVPEILDVMTRYYTARAEKDVDTIKTIKPNFSVEEEAELRNSNPIESYNNITVYSREGLTEGSYIVYIYFDAKIVGINTQAPTLTNEYLETNESGDLIIVDKKGTQERADFVEMMKTTNDVQKMIADVNQKLQDAREADADLNAYVEALLEAQQGGSTSGDDSEDGSDDSSASAGTMAANSTVQATTDVRVRSEASTDGAIYGQLSTGMNATVLESLDNGWTKVQYTANGVMIEGYVMTQYLTAVN